MTEIIDFNKAKLIKEEDHHVTDRNFLAKISFIDVTELLVKKFLKVSQISAKKFFIGSLPKEVLDGLTYGGKKVENAFSDLNVLAEVERMIGLKPIIFAPTCTDANNNGWFAGFNLDGSMFSSPEIVTEIMARAFNVLLFLYLKDTINVKYKQ